MRLDVAVACAAFVSVSEHESFTHGAAALGIPQPVASRRVAALEEMLGGALLKRSTKRVALTPFGTRLLARAKEIADGPEKLRADAASLLAAGSIISFPRLCDSVALARFAIAYRRVTGSAITTTVGDPPTRARLLVDGTAGFSLEPIAPDESTWSVPLGMLSKEEAPSVKFLSTLRPGRSHKGRLPRLWLHPEDETPHVKDRLEAVGNSLGLGPRQIRVARDLAHALTGVFGAGDFLLGTETQAAELGLEWSRIGELHLTRGYRIAASVHEQEWDKRCNLLVSECLGTANPVPMSEAT